MEDKKQPTRPESVLRKMERMMGGAVKGKTDQRKAQDLVYDSWDAADADDAYHMLADALDLDPTNVDAWLGILDFEPLKGEEEIEFLRRLIFTGRKNLGEKTFKEDKGHFWGLLETRPYMRARSRLAMRLMEVGRFEESIIEYEGMLELNPNDNQGVRYGLMSCYLAANRLDGAKRLFEQYDERTFSAAWAWAWILERLLSGAPAEATDALIEARKQNPHAQAYFAEHRKLPKAMPGSYGLHSREEAIIAWSILQYAWKKHPEAQAWLRAQAGKKGK
jgi:tetratricopeptide (TPR) repeat protein